MKTPIVRDSLVLIITPILVPHRDRGLGNFDYLYNRNIHLNHKYNEKISNNSDALRSNWNDCIL